MSITLQQRRTPGVQIELNEPVLESLAAALGRARERGYVDGRAHAGGSAAIPPGAEIRELADAGDARDGGRRSDRRRPVGGARRARADADREGGYLKTDLDARRELLGDLVRSRGEGGGAGRRGCRPGCIERVRELRADALATKHWLRRRLPGSSARSDITEEVVRFRSHLEHWRALTDSPEPCGRKLDFLLQEMNREVNTRRPRPKVPASRS